MAWVAIEINYYFVSTVVHCYSFIPKGPEVSLYLYKTQSDWINVIVYYQHFDYIPNIPGNYTSILLHK